MKNLKVFVSSTTDDLRSQREYAVERLGQMGVHVLDMKNMTSEPESPHQVCSRYVTECDILIVIVAFRRGTIVVDDPANRSITQIEVDTANRHGKKILPYVLKDSPENHAAWPERFNELYSDPALIAWRRWLGTKFTPVEFQANEQPDVLPAVHKRLVEVTNSQLRHVRRIFATGVLVLLAVLLLGAFVPQVRFTGISLIHAYHDPVIFNSAQSGVYKTARLLESRADIQDNTSFTRDIEQATV